MMGDFITGSHDLPSDLHVHDNPFLNMRKDSWLEYGRGLKNFLLALISSQTDGLATHKPGSSKSRL